MLEYNLTPDQLARAADSASRRPRPEMENPFSPARSSTELTLVDIWAEVLEYSFIGKDDNFFALGGDSLQMTQIGARIFERTGVEVSFADFFVNPTVSLLAQQIDSLQCPLNGTSGQAE